MRYYYLDAARHRHGPYTLPELRELFRARLIGMETPLVPEDGFEPVQLRELLEEVEVGAGRGSEPPPLPGQEPGLAGQAGEDLRVLIPHLLMPFEALRERHWLRNRRFLTMAAVGLLPLLLMVLFGGVGDVRPAYWALAFYFSALWAVFFYVVFPTPGIRISRASACFFGTGLFSITLLLLAYSVPPLSWVRGLLGVDSLLVQLLVFILGVGVPEETCKAVMLLVLARQGGWVAPRSMVFYGLMSGLGFGIYEGVGYQLGRNLSAASGVGEYYLLNLLRLTTLPFLHAMWTGIAGYFIGFALQYPRRRHGLWVVAIGLPALLHGIYNTFSGSLLGLAVAVLTVLALNLYVTRSFDFESALRRDA